MLRTPLQAIRRRCIPAASAGRSARRLYADETTTGRAAASKLNRVESRLPRFLRRFTAPLRQAPVSHVAAFFVLHELTAVVPLFGLAAFFHYSQWLPPYLAQGQWVREGTERVFRWLRKRGWITDEDDRGHHTWAARGEGGVRLAVEIATAYVITKALLPLRIPLSIWLTPWFARWTVLPATSWFRRTFWKAKTSKITPAATTRADAARSVKPLPTDGLDKK